MLASLEGELQAAPSLLSKTLRGKKDVLHRESILAGAGDSYAAALCSSYLFPKASTAADPYELVASPEVARSKTVVFLSVSGRTRSNIAAARRVDRIATETIAITADEKSPLAKIVDRTIPLPYDYRPRAPGIASFSLMLAASARLLSADLHVNFTRALLKGKRMSRKLGFAREGVTFFLGNRALYAISIYAAAKLYEVFGARATCQRLEEFSHLELFSLGRRDTVNIYEGFDPLSIGQALAKSLRQAGYDSRLASTVTSNDFERVFAAVFATQFAILRWAGGMRMTRPYLSDAQQKLGISDSMIYEFSDRRNRRLQFPRSGSRS